MNLFITNYVASLFCCEFTPHDPRSPRPILKKIPRLPFLYANLRSEEVPDVVLWKYLKSPDWLMKRSVIYRI